MFVPNVRKNEGYLKIVFDEEENQIECGVAATFSIKGEKILITAQGRTLEKLRRQIDEELWDLEDILGLEKGTISTTLSFNSKA